MSKTKINWKKVAEEAAEWVSAVMSEAHREIIPWHGPTSTWLAFDTSFDTMNDPEGYMSCLCENLEMTYYKIRASALNKDKDTLAILFTSAPDAPGGDETDTA